MRDVQAERLGGREIDDKLEFGRLLDWYIAGLRAAQNPIHVICRVPSALPPEADIPPRLSNVC